jgi:hypothetical protein
MDWPGAFIPGVAVPGAALATLRTTLHPRKWTMVGIGLPGAALICRQAACRQAWIELALGIAPASLLLLALWWRTIACHLRPPTDSSISVWTRDETF